MKKNMSLITAVLMTMAALVWIFNAAVLSDSGSIVMRSVVAAVFVALAIVYWARYFMRRNNPTPNNSTEGQ